jgi:DNA-binding MarR family transcriptional regulator
MDLFGLASGRQVDHLVARLCEVGYMELRPSEQDGRVRILASTEKLRAHDREWLAAHFAPLTVLYPQHDYGPVMRRDPAIQAALRRAFAPMLPVAAEILQSAPDMMMFLNLAAGYPILAALLQIAMWQGGDAPIAVPYTEIGDRFGVSRTHIRALLTEAEASALVRLHARGGGSVEILPRLWASHDRGMAGGTFLNDAGYVLATAELRAAAG